MFMKDRKVLKSWNAFVTSFKTTFYETLLHEALAAIRSLEQKASN